ncbi:uncharacterized protein (DUF885 family) [Actinoalloteichus hoggarensis]|uniref:Uncharacterized protein n=1 Tax=Actinoalloteichus hoggarensis TaxID=1470176 RepID=A0A221W4Q1_9PSEU|nr:DUF885 domain-containing protein [Actinoalloteichus hoggarensis]ASO20631.1 hypothetical protein AHOG_14950 [Actinoalloteichus hoggarensis]MBB5923672.1 uncharacterized protein (DUF885 family) [Actinoalloteichus hoggarensis]
MTPAETFRTISEREWEWRLGELGRQHYGSALGVDDFLPDESPEAHERRAAHWRDVLAQVSALDVDALDAVSRVNLAVYVQQVETLVTAVEHRQYERPANADTAFWTTHADRANGTLHDVTEAEAFLRQLAELPRWFSQHIENMRAGLARGFGPARVSMAGRSDPVRSVASAETAEKTRYAAPFTQARAAGIIDEALLSRALEVIGSSVIPAHADLLRFLEEEYLPALPEEIAATKGPGGREYYLAQLAEYNTTRLTPEEIFALGEENVAAIREEMVAVAHEAGFDGDVPRMLEFMRTDSRFYATTAEDLLKEAAWHTKRFDGIVHEYFGRVPMRRFGIIEPPPELAPYYTFGRGGIDRYTLNTYNLPARPLYSLSALTLHEAAPGHCFQIALASELADLPAFRRHVYISAYGEGWALYTERLGVEMGMYRDPFETMGMLSFQMWRAVRLVVDPGMHAFGWSRERAQEFLRSNTAIAEHEIVTEIDRYIAWPGQATAYFIGQLRIMRLRRLAEDTLGQAFDIRWFHDAVLGLGSVPLAVLEDEIERAIRARAADHEGEERA